MTTNIARRSLPLLAASAIATVGLAACAGGSSETGERSGTSETHSTEDASVGEAEKCNEEQLATLTSATGVAVSAASLALANAEFTPTSVLGDLKTICVISFNSAGVSGGYAVLPGGDETLSAAASNARAAGAQVTEAAGTFTASVDGVTVFGAKFGGVTQQTAGFESTDDLIVIVATSLSK